jgi:hypothetical protein
MNMDSRPSKTQFTLNQTDTNKGVSLFILPAVLLLSIPFLLIWNNNILLNIKHILITKIYITLPILITGIIIHELLHGLTWALFAKGGIKSIKFGFSKNNYAPYCHCTVPIRLKYYIFGGLLPAVVLGFLPIILSWFTGNLAIFLFGVVFCIAAGSDILICCKLRNLNMDAFVQDFPDKPGCYLIPDKFENKN